MNPVCVLIGKDPDAGKDWRQEKGTIEDEVVGWRHWLEGYEFEQAPGVGDGQGSLACCSPWGCKELDTTERLNWTEVTEVGIYFRKKHGRIFLWQRDSDWILCMCCCFSHAWLFVNLWAIAFQAPQSMEFSRQGYWSGLPCPPPGDLPNQGSNLSLLHLLHCRRILYCWATEETPGNESWRKLRSIPIK